MTIINLRIGRPVFYINEKGDVIAVKIYSFISDYEWEVITRFPHEVMMAQYGRNVFVSENKAIRMANEYLLILRDERIERAKLERIERASLQIKTHEQKIKQQQELKTKVKQFKEKELVENAEKEHQRKLELRKEFLEMQELMEKFNSNNPTEEQDINSLPKRNLCSSCGFPVNEFGLCGCS